MVEQSSENRLAAWLGLRWDFLLAGGLQGAFYFAAQGGLLKAPAAATVPDYYWQLLLAVGLLACAVAVAWPAAEAPAWQHTRAGNRAAGRQAVQGLACGFSIVGLGLGLVLLLLRVAPLSSGVSWWEPLLWGGSGLAYVALPVWWLCKLTAEWSAWG